MNKRGQMKLSFGMIFSIILIIVFLSFAFYSVKKILEMKDVLDTASFVNDFQKDIDRMWVSSRALEEVNYSLKNEVKEICFIDLSSSIKGKFKIVGKDARQMIFNDKNNLFFNMGDYSGTFESFFIKHLDLGKITEKNNPNCFRTIKDKNAGVFSSKKIIFTLKKEYNNPLVIVE